MNDPGPRRFRYRLALVIVLLIGIAALALMKRFWLGSAYEAAEKAAIQQVLERQDEAWNRGDLDGFMEGYWNSPDLTYFSKSERHGWDSLMEHYRTSYQAPGSEMGQLTFSDLNIELLGPDSAFVRGRWQVVTQKETLGGLFTLIFRKKPEGWRIVHDHTSKEEK